MPEGHLSPPKPAIDLDDEKLKGMKIYKVSGEPFTNGVSAARYIGVSPSTLRRYGEAGLLPRVVFPTGISRYALSGVVNLREVLGQNERRNRPVAGPQDFEMQSKAETLLHEPGLQFSDEVVSILQGLASGRQPGQVARELGIDKAKVKRVIDVGTSLIERIHRGQETS